jgi:hypothetical protein
VSRQKPQPPPPPKPVSLSDSIITGNVKAATMARTTNGYALVILDLTPEDQQRLTSAGRMTVGKSQSFPEHVAPMVKSAQAALAQEVQLRKGRAA